MQISIFIIGALSFVSLHLAQAATHSEKGENSVSVTGSCLRSVQPDETQVQLGARVRHVDALKASQAASQIYEKVLKRIKSLGLKNAEFATTSMSVNRVYDYENNRTENKGFEAYSAFVVRTSDLQRAGEIFKAGQEAGANEVAGPSLGLSKRLYQKEYEACLEVAAQNARSKALVIAKALSAQLSGQFMIEEVEDTAQYFGRAQMMASDASFSNKEAAPTIEAKSEDVKVTLRASFELK